MATAQITAVARLQAISQAYTRNEANQIVVKEGENLDTIFARALKLVNLEAKDATESQKTQFRNSFPAVRSEVYAGSCIVKDDDGNEVNAFEFLSAKKIKKPDMLKKLQSTYKDRIVTEGKLLPTPEGFSGNGQKGRKAVRAATYFDQI